jgi:hypothetical protein
MITYTYIYFDLLLRTHFYIPMLLFRQESNSLDVVYDLGLQYNHQTIKKSTKNTSTKHE